MFFQRCRCLGGLGAGAAVLALVCCAGTLHAQSIRSEFEAVDRIVAIGDVHGAYDTFVANLKATGLVDDALDWIGGKTHLVQTGDVLDRGPHSRKAIDLLMKLEPEAEAAGGRVHALIGNHEFFNAVGALDYVSDAELEAFAGVRDRVLRKFRGVTAPGVVGAPRSVQRRGRVWAMDSEEQRRRPDRGYRFRAWRGNPGDNGAGARRDQSPRARRFRHRGPARQLLVERRRAPDDAEFFRRDSCFEGGGHSRGAG